jgi:hypothetical protein
MVPESGKAKSIIQASGRVLLMVELSAKTQDNTEHHKMRVLMSDDQMGFYNKHTLVIIIPLP